MNGRNTFLLNFACNRIMFNKTNYNDHYLHLGTIFNDCIKDEIIFIWFCKMQISYIIKLYLLCVFLVYHKYFTHIHTHTQLSTRKFLVIHNRKY